MKKLAIFGASGHGRVAMDCAQLMQKWSEVVFYDDNLLPNRSFEALLDTPPEALDAFVAIGNNRTREELQLKLQSVGFNIPVIKHPSAIVANDVVVLDGTLLVAGAIVNPGSKLGYGCVINTSASVDHDCKLEDFVHISPGARLAGTVKIGNRSWIGIGSTICENRTVGADVMVAAGAVVIKDIPDNETVMGVPAR